DMKSILAYSTISALGIIVFLIGVGSEHALYAAMTFILVHALYKAALFLTTGIVDHAVHSRDISKISGLKNIMPLVAIASFVAALSSAGVPLTFGFISKDLIYESTLHIPEWAYIITGVAVLTNILLVCSGFMAGIKPFIGKLPQEYARAHKPSAYLWVPVLILSFLTLIFGIFPALADEAIIKIAFQTLGKSDSDISLKIWHGFGLVLLLSGVTILVGLVLFLGKKYSVKPLHVLEKFDGLSPKSMVDYLVEGVRNFAFQYTRFFHNGYLRNYLITIIIFIIGLVGYRLFTSVPIQVNTKDLSGFRWYELTIFVMILIGIYITIKTKSRLT